VVLRIVEIDQREMLHSQAGTALGHRIDHPATRIVAILGVDLGGDQKPFGRGPGVAQCRADPLLALAVRVTVGRIDHSDRAGEDVADDADSLLFRSVIAEQLRHATQRAATGRNGRHG
jgi:hypothetical protein